MTAPWIENEAAYEAAKEARIKANARIGRSRRWFAEQPDREQLVAFLRTGRGEFLAKMFDAVEEWGSLTPGQEAAVRKIMTQQAERKAAQAASDATSTWIGEIGKRQVFELTAVFHSSFETQFGVMHVCGFKDAAGNIVIYEGSSDVSAERGVRVIGKATVKDHGVREGVKQTIISRPAFNIAN